LIMGVDFLAMIFVVVYVVLLLFYSCSLLWC
jgi:hypothetical protein